MPTACIFSEFVEKKNRTCIFHLAGQTTEELSLSIYIYIYVTICYARPNGRTVKRLCLSSKHFPRSSEHEILVPLSIMGVWKNDQKSIVDECASQVTLFVQTICIGARSARYYKNEHKYLHIYLYL